MTMHTDSHRKVHEPRLPLAGMTDVLTYQLNVTLHPRKDSVKWVATLRDPMDGTEYARWSHEPSGWVASIDDLRRDLDTMVAALSDFWRVETAQGS